MIADSFDGSPERDVVAERECLEISSDRRLRLYGEHTQQALLGRTGRWQLLDTGDALVVFQRVPEGKAAKNRVHLDVRAAPGLTGGDRMAALEAEALRLIDLGARRVRRFEPAPPMEAGFIVMTDPEGNEFCLD